MRRGDLRNEQWERLEPLLPPRKSTGRPPKDHRQIINGILWVLRKGGIVTRHAGEALGNVRIPRGSSSTSAVHELSALEVAQPTYKPYLKGSVGDSQTAQYGSTSTPNAEAASASPEVWLPNRQHDGFQHVGVRRQRDHK
jgi:hypothetical protein